MFWLSVFEPIDDLEEKLVELLARNGTDFEMVEALCEKIGDIVQVEILEASAATLRGKIKEK